MSENLHADHYAMELEADMRRLSQVNQRRKRDHDFSESESDHEEGKEDEEDKQEARPDEYEYEDTYILHPRLQAAFTAPDCQVYKITQKGPLADKIQLAKAHGLHFVFAHAQTFVQDNDVKKKYSDYYCCQSLLEFQSWWRRRDTKKFVQIDEVYTSKEPVAFVLDFEHSLDEKPNPSPIPEIIKQFSDAVHDLAQEEYNMTVQSQWIWNDNSRWTTEKGSQKYKLSLHLINSHLIFTNIRHLEAFMVQLIEKKLPQYPPPIVDLSIYRRSSGQFRLPFCQKAGCPNKNFVCTDAPFHEYFIVKPNADPLSLISVDGARVEHHRQPPTRTHVTTSHVTENKDIPSWVYAAIESKCPGSRVKLEYNKTHPDIINVTHQQKPYTCCIQTATSHTIHHSQNGYLTPFGANCFQYHCHDRVSCGGLVALLRKPCDPFDWNQHRVEAYDGRYCRPFEVGPGAPKWQLVIAPMGSGKTERLVEYLNHLWKNDRRVSFVVLCMRISLAHGLHSRLQVIDSVGFYQDMEIDRDATRICIEYESIHKLRRRYDVVVMDEAVSLLASITSPTNGDQQICNWKMLCKLLETAKHVIAMDADMEVNVAVRLLVDKFARGQTVVTRSLAPPQERTLVLYPHEYIVVDDKKLSTHTNTEWENNMRASITNQEKIAIIVSSKQWSDTMYKRLTSEFGLQTSEILYYRSDMDDVEFRKLHDVDQVWGQRDVRVVMYTSKVSVGVNVTVPFDRMFVQCSQGLKARDLGQMIGRIRTLRRPFIDVLIPQMQQFDEEPFADKFATALAHYSKRHRDLVELVVGPEDALITVPELPVQLHVVYQIEPTSTWLWKFALDKGWRVLLRQTGDASSTPAPTTSYAEEFWNSVVADVFPIDETQYDDSLGRIQRKMASERDHVIVSLYQVQRLFDLRHENPIEESKPQRKKKTKDEAPTTCKSIIAHLTDYASFCTLKKSLTKILGFSVLTKTAAQPQRLQRYIAEEQARKSGIFCFLASFPMAEAEMLIEVASDLGLANLLDTTTHFAGRLNPDIERKIHHLRSVHKWRDKNDIPALPVHVLSHVLTDLFGISLISTTQKRLKTAGKDQSGCNTKVMHYRLSTSSYVVGMAGALQPKRLRENIEDIVNL